MTYTCCHLYQPKVDLLWWGCWRTGPVGRADLHTWGRLRRHHALSAASFNHNRRESQTRGLLLRSMLWSVSTEIWPSVVNWLSYKSSASRAVHSVKRCCVDKSDFVYNANKSVQVFSLWEVYLVRAQAGCHANWQFPAQCYWMPVGLIALMKFHPRYSSGSWKYWQNSAVTYHCDIIVI